MFMFEVNPMHNNIGNGIIFARVVYRIAGYHEETMPRLNERMADYS